MLFLVFQEFRTKINALNAERKTKEAELEKVLKTKMKLAEKVVRTCVLFSSFARAMSRDKSSIAHFKRAPPQVTKIHQMAA
jgi:hypothetical protein